MAERRYVGGEENDRVGENYDGEMVAERNEIVAERNEIMAKRNEMKAERNEMKAEEMN